MSSLIQLNLHRNSCIFLQNKTMPYFSLEGSVCSGKSTVLKLLAEFMKLEGKFCHAVPEPEFLFTNYKNVYNPLVEMQKDPTRNTVITQIHILSQSRDYYSRALARDSPLFISD